MGTRGPGENGKRFRDSIPGRPVPPSCRYISWHKIRGCVVSWHPTLSSIERGTDLPQDRPRPVTDTQRREAALKTVSAFWDRCWCGQPYQHDWPGKDTGTSHPRGGAA